MMALSFIVATFVCIAGVSIGQVPPVGPATTPQLVINEVMPLGDNEHFGLTNPGTVKVNLGDFQVSIDQSRWIRLPARDLAPGEEVNVLFNNKKAKLTELNEPGQDNLYIDAPELTLNDRFGRVTVKDDAGVVGELTYDNHLSQPLYLT